VLARFLHSAVAANSEEQVNTFRAEVEFVRAAISKFGERVPLACTYLLFRACFLMLHIFIYFSKKSTICKDVGRFDDARQRVTIHAHAFVSACHSHSNFFAHGGSRDGAAATHEPLTARCGPDASHAYAYDDDDGQCERALRCG
jgi:hypothetical protein